SHEESFYVGPSAQLARPLWPSSVSVCSRRSPSQRTTKRWFVYSCLAAMTAATWSFPSMTIRVMPMAGRLLTLRYRSRAYCRLTFPVLEVVLDSIPVRPDCMDFGETEKQQSFAMSAHWWNRPTEILTSAGRHEFL